MPSHDLVHPLIESGEVPGGFRRASHIGTQGSEQVPIRDDAAELLVLIRHQQVMKTLGVKDLFDHSQPIVHFNGDDPGRHDIAQSHRRALVPKRSDHSVVGCSVYPSERMKQTVFALLFAVTAFGSLARAADPQPYRVDIASVGNGDMDATLKT